MDLTAAPLTDAQRLASGACLIAVARTAGSDSLPSGFGVADLDATFDSAPIGMALVSRGG